jgi:hypothetical protein
VQAHAPGHSGIDMRSCVIQSTSGCSGQALREPAHIGLGVEPGIDAHQAASPVHPDGVRAVHQHIRRVGVAEVGLERACPHHLLTELSHELQHGVIAKDQALLAQGGRHSAGSRVPVGSEQARSDALDKRGGHRSPDGTPTSIGSRRRTARP